MRLAVLSILLALTVAGAAALAFLCDDAFITFRYVANARDGLGLVWNPPPFLPVEGYTGFLWALILWATWAVFGVEPPDSVNVLSILCGVGQFVVLAVAAFRLRGRDGQRVGDGIALVTLACITGNRTFLQWMTSGLETALFNLALLSWVLLAFRAAERRDARWLLSWSAAAAVAALTRPDGLLLVAATAVIAVPALVVPRRRLQAAVLGLLPLLTVLAHVLWRRWFYGDWLPNTYFAKIVAAWPEAGGRYFACFLFEHGLWLWMPVALVWSVVWVARHRADLLPTVWRLLPALAALGVLAFHAAYYLVQVGGDHFEYRVLSHLVPLAWLSFAAMVAQLARRRVVTVVWLVVLFLLSSFGWAHLWLNRDTEVRGFNPIAAQLPAVLQPIGRWFDRHQGWLHMHFICLRCNQHAMALREFDGTLPERGRYALPDGDIPVKLEAAVGLAGWVLSDCAIIDWHGLNDWVVARTKAPAIDANGVLSESGLLQRFAEADADGDGWLLRPELNRWLYSFVPGTVPSDDPHPLVSVMLKLFAVERLDAISMTEAQAIAASTFKRGCIAHEHTPPPGYTEAFEANVLAVATGVVVTPRAVPLAPRIPAIEAEWRAKAARGELRGR